MSLRFSLKPVPRFERLGVSYSRCFLHSSPRNVPRSSSRTRLVKNLKPVTGRGRLEVAPRGRQSQPEWHRRPVPPHSGRQRSNDNSASGRYESDTRRKGQSKDTPRPTENSSQWPPMSSVRSNIPVFNELYHPPAPATISLTNKRAKTLSDDKTLPTSFMSPPLMPGFVASLTETLGPKPRPTPIQALSIKWLLDPKTGTRSSGSEWKQFLLAAETGSGKSIAYLLPVLQDLKQSETRMPDSMAKRRQSAPELDTELNPRALVLAPTHELSRQLAGFAKSLIHEVKLRVLSASRPNVRNARDDKSSGRKMLARFEEMENSGDVEAAKKAEIGKASFPVDLVVGTPMKLLEMVRGRGWDRQEREDGTGDMKESRRPRETGKPEMGLANVEWVVVDEADVLFDPDFQEFTRMLLADISAARGVPVPFSRESSLSAKALSSTNKSKPVNSTGAQPFNYPFHLVLTTATIPSALASYLDTHHPNLVRLASPNLHHLPKTLKIEHAAWTGGNKLADIEHRIRRVWADESTGSRSGPALFSKILIFCNKSIKVEELGSYLTERGIKNIALTSSSEERRYGSNKHLQGFLRPLSSKQRSEQGENLPRVMITTSLLSRGLDFSPDLRHVFIVDRPRNMIDFLHRAGRSGRAGQKGNVVIFGKTKGRGSARTKEVKRKVYELTA